MKNVNLTIPAQKRREGALERLNKISSVREKSGKEKEIQTLKSRLNMGQKEGTKGRRNERKRKNVF